MALHFSREEFSKRKQDVLKSMKEQNLDALLMFRQESMYWLTGYDTFGYVFFQNLVLDQKGNIVLLTRAPDLRQAQNTSNIQDIRIWVDKDGINPTDDLKIILDEFDLKNKNIGILITDHNVQETLAITDKTYLMFEGKILKAGSPEELAQDEMVRKVYLGQNFELRKKRIKF